MKRIPAAARSLRLTLVLTTFAFPPLGIAADDVEAEREARRIEFESRRMQEQGRRDMEERERAQAESLRSQEEAIRRMEDTQSQLRTQAAAQQLEQQAAEQSRIISYIESRSFTPSVTPVPDPPRAAEMPLNLPSPPAPATAPPPDLHPQRQAREEPVRTMTFAPLSAQLRRYFGAESGILVIDAGVRGSLFGLRDGDVIMSIDGRFPADGAHVVAILGSYRAGERVGLRVLRDRQVIDIATVVPRQRR